MGPGWGLSSWACQEADFWHFLAELQKHAVDEMLQPLGCLRLCLKIGLPTVGWNSAVSRPDSEK